MIRIKICCISSIEELNLAVKYGASAIGLVSSMPSGPGVISDDLISVLSSKVPPVISSFLLTSSQQAGEIIAQQKKARTNTIQLCDRLISGTHMELKKAMPGVSIVQVIHVADEESLEEAKEISRHVSGLLLDSGSQNLKVKQLGGTGRTHDWEISRKIVESVNVPVYLAGGLNESNAAEAIRQVRPFGLDICSGVRTNGRLDEKKLSAFINAVKNSF